MTLRETEARISSLFFRKEKWFYITLRVICLSLPGTGIMAVSKIALNFSVLKIKKRTGALFQEDLKTYGYV